MKLTAEQESIVENQSRDLIINAFAGSAKTTTLDFYSRARPTKSILYLAFSTAAKLHASKIFPKNVRCVTPHSLAFPDFGAHYQSTGKLIPGLRTSHIAKLIDLSDVPPEMHFYAANLCINAINKFLTNNDTCVTPNSVDDLVMPNNFISEEYICKMANMIWEKMKDISDTSVGMTHDGYLKLYYQSRPKLAYDHILFDEAQDANSVMANVVNDQTHASRIIVGDEHQSIFAFRHAVNAMSNFKADDTLHLTKSFRFGPDIANVGNFLLSKYKKETRQIIGNDAVRSRVGFVSPSGSCAIIARGNATLFAEAVNALTQNRKIHHVGGVEGYRFSDMLDAHHLMTNNHGAILNPQIRAFKDFESFSEYADVSGDKEFRGVAGLARRHGASLPRLVKAVRSSSQKDASQAEIHLSTTHKAKGLEWDNVKLTDDFINLFGKDGAIADIPQTRIEDINIAYVAATRAKKVLQPYSDLTKILRILSLSTADTDVPTWAIPLNSL